MGKIKELVDKFVEDGVLTREEHDEFIQTIHADGQVDAEESAEISRLFKLIQEGKLQVVDQEREASQAKRREEVQRKLRDLE
jgi:polyhydroxyalkanoate synthesis regulator phasin